MQPPRTAGAARMTRLLHRDRVASVFLGTIGDDPTPVTVTLAHERISGSRREVFLEWAAKLARVSSHPRIAPIAAIGLTENARPYVAVQGTRTSLADALRESGPAPAGRVRALGVALADTLAAVHERGLIHGALQPATVLVGPGRQLLVSGFDACAPVLARPLPPSAYTAPEHIDTAVAGEVTASPAADVYDLATLLYAALGGRLPWPSTHRDSHTDIMLRGAPIPDIPGISTALTDVLGTALSADPRQRPRADELRDALSGVDVSAPLSAGTRPTAINPALVPSSGPRPVTLPQVTDLVTTRPRKRRLPQLRVGRTATGVAGVALAIGVVGGAGLATFAATQGDVPMGCPGEDEVTQAVASLHPEATVVDRTCAEGYVGVTLETGPGTGVGHDEGAHSLRLTLQSVNGELIEVANCQESLPRRIKEYLDC